MKQIVLAIPFVVFMVAANAASFDCGKAGSNYEKLVCADSNLGMLDQGMSDVYRQVLALSPAAEKEAIVSNQRKWIASISKQLQEKISQKTPEKDLKAWLGRALQESVGKLRSRIVIGKLVVVDSTPENDKTCSFLLNRQNMCADSGDTAECANGLKLPSDFSTPEWSADQANFDFDNQGKSVDVFSVDIEATHIVDHYYIVAEPHESDAIQSRLDDVVGVNDQLDLMDDFKIVGPSPRKGNHAPRFSSRLFDAAFSPVYGGQGSARSQIVRFHGSTYMVATATNDFIPTFVLFRPSKAVLEPICYFWVNNPWRK